MRNKEQWFDTCRNADIEKEEDGWGVEGKDTPAWLGVAPPLGHCLPPSSLGWRLREFLAWCEWSLKKLPRLLDQLSISYSMATMLDGTETLPPSIVLDCF
jgi:hypothetical protein